MDPVVHFELPAEDRKRMVAFYTHAFGWQTNQLGPEMGNYVVVMTSETGPDGAPKNKGTINGGFYEKTKDDTARHPSIVVAVQDIHQAIAKVKAAGGRIEGEPMPIPGVGLFVGIIDTEGNRIAMLQADPMPPVQ